jgi:hypothetical protein
MIPQNKPIILGDNDNCLIEINHTQNEYRKTYANLSIETRSRIDTQFSQTLNVWGVSIEQLQNLIDRLIAIRFQMIRWE